MGYDEDGMPGLLELVFVEWSLFPVVFFPSPFLAFFISGFGSVVHFLLDFASSLTGRSTCSHRRRFLLSCVASLTSISSALPFRTYLSLHRTHTIVCQLRYNLLFFYTCL